MPLVARCRSSFLRTVTFLIIHRFLPLKFPLLYICFSKSTAYNTFQFKKMFWIWWKVLDTIILWQDVGPCCEQAHAAFEVRLSLDHGQGVYSSWSDVVVSSQLRLCHTCIIDVMNFCHHFICWRSSTITATTSTITTTTKFGSHMSTYIYKNVNSPLWGEFTSYWSFCC